MAWSDKSREAAAKARGANSNKPPMDKRTLGIQSQIDKLHAEKGKRKGLTGNSRNSNTNIRKNWQ